MSEATKHTKLIKQLKKQVLVLQRREEKTRNRMKAALKKVRKLGLLKILSVNC